MKRMMTAIEKLEKSCTNVNSVVDSMIRDIVVIAGQEIRTKKPRNLICSVKPGRPYPS